MTVIIDGSASAEFETPLPVAEGGTGVTASTGSGNVVLSASPTLTGTVTAAALTLTTPLPVASGGSVIKQIVNAQYTAVASGTTAMPYDDTIPQNTEGNEFMTLAITPTSATSKLKIDVAVNWAGRSTVRTTFALFQDSTADAIAAFTHQTSANEVMTTSFSHTMTSGTTSATTIKLRYGGTSGTVTMNGVLEVRKNGGVGASSITITEYTA